MPSVKQTQARSPIGGPTPTSDSQPRSGLSPESVWRASVRVVGSIVLALAVMASLLMALGADPWISFTAIVDASLGNRFNVGQTVMIASILALTGLAAAIPFAARLWNIGGEGQLYVGALAAAGLGLTLPETLPTWLTIVALVSGSMLAGGAWGAVPGVLKAGVGANEVIVSLMMTFIALLLANYGISELWPQGTSPQTEYLPQNARLPVIWSGTLVTLGAPMALAAVCLAWIVMSRSALGFQIRAIGLNAVAARANGMSVGRDGVIAFVLGGAFAGLGGAIAVMGINGALVSGFSSNFGYFGIAVALLARLSPGWIIPSAFLFAVLRVGSNGLQVETGLSPDVGDVLVATFVVMLLAFKVIRLRYTSVQE